MPKYIYSENCIYQCGLLKTDWAGSVDFFSQRVINRWNSLTQEDIDAVSMNSFKNKLEKKRTCQMDFFKDK